MELVWNAIDADATEIEVLLRENALGVVDGVRVVDNGAGMTPDFAIGAFTGLGGSWKAVRLRSPGNRPLHGRGGQGRWRAFGIGPRVVWETVAEIQGRRVLTVIRGSADRLGGFEILDPEETERPFGTVVIVDSFAEPPAGLQGDGANTRLTTTFALMLQAFPISVVYGGVRLDPAGLQVAQHEYDLDAPGEADGASLTIIEWKMSVDRFLYLCDENGVPLYEMKPHIHAPGFDFTAYLRWAGFGRHVDLLPLVDLGATELEPVMEKARVQLREHFRVRSTEVSRLVIEGWKEEESYPYRGEPADVVERAERDLFDVVAVAASEAVNSGGDARGRRLSLGLIRVALENDPGGLHEVLGHVLDLPAERVEELRELLHHTSLASIITSAKTIANRLEFLKALELLVFEPETKARLLERSQLHRILATETWVFGEEYALTANDESLNAVLTKHLKLLGAEREAGDAEVHDHEGRRRIVDLMLARSLEQTQNRREHLVVELKAPRVRIGSKELTQVKSYAFAVVEDERFNKADVRWDFVVISNELDAFAEQERNQRDRRDGLLYQTDQVRIWVRTWAEAIEACNHRLKFVRKALDYDPLQQDALEYLRAAHHRYLPDNLKVEHVAHA
jgi:Histidine kinase-, DNA gyrase B-, and HSP90-like ATPase